MTDDHGVDRDYAAYEKVRKGGRFNIKCVNREHLSSACRACEFAKACRSGALKSSPTTKGQP